MKRFSFLIIFLLLTTCVHAFSVQEIQRLRAVKQLLYGIDSKSLQQTMDELQKTHHPQLYLQMREAMAKTYTDIVQEENVSGQKKKEWLYSMVCLNMAYLQFAGTQGSPGATTALNKLIRRKLRAYLPADIFKQPGFLYSLE